ncbi:hypothetical protein [Methylobacterium marchantiae]|uniref:Uncharacterized protein n=1 Tax=Methylobacterium marchantiae TaxID=600331 RepID=A0ABW3X1Y2_9HYPH|nr:hypothetical protein AIGOOFII_1482 [Methylobacterium marchantiae]
MMIAAGTGALANHVDFAFVGEQVSGDSSASDPVFTHRPNARLALLASVFCTVRSVFERGLFDTETYAMQKQLGLMCNVSIKIIMVSD